MTGVKQPFSLWLQMIPLSTNLSHSVLRSAEFLILSRVNAGRDYPPTAENTNKAAGREMSEKKRHKLRSNRENKVSGASGGRCSDITSEEHSSTVLIQQINLSVKLWTTRPEYTVMLPGAFRDRTKRPEQTGCFQTLRKSELKNSPNDGNIFKVSYFIVRTEANKSLF